MNIRLLPVLVAAALMSAGEVRAQQVLTEQDRVQIQDLSARYAKALGGCDAEAYADLFVPGTGYFASNIRGEVVGRERLMALVRSERHCIGGVPAANTPPRPVPTVAIESTSKGVTGRADLGNVGYYDDEYVYVRTQQGGWRFKARAYVAPDAPAAGDSRRTQP